MNRLLEHYFSFQGRLGRVPFFVRTLYLTIAAWIVTFAAIPLFSTDTRLGWWAGLAVVIAGLAMLIVGLVSIIVRRLHDLGLSGYHAIWVGMAEAGWGALSYGPPGVILLALPLLAIDLWLIFWPGNAGANRFGEAPA